MWSSAKTGSNADSVSSARRDIHDRTLSKISVPLERLVYLASLRDYSSGRYYHDGLAMRFTEKIAAEALKQEHMDVFLELVHCSLKSLVEQLNRYLNSLREDRTEILRTWENLEPYRVIVPLGADRLAIHLFVSNIRFAVAILGAQQRVLPEHIGSASQPQ